MNATAPLSMGVNPSQFVSSTQAAGSATGASQTAASRMLAHSLNHGPKPELKSTFQDFVAGTFYKEMMKSLRKMHGKAAYFNGGQAEQIFQGQMDQQVAEDLAHNRGGDFANSLYKAYLHSGRA